ncbi:MAG TPA: hypothetical protein VN898_09675 [Candidatus Binatia bacterium]|nr:hypothetical protein [Candidatus Binatia bacterium]
MYTLSHQQRVRVCKALLSLIDYRHLWTSEGPTAEAKAYLDQYGGPMSNSQWILYQVAWLVWGRPADVKVQEVMHLPAPYAKLAISLLNSLATDGAAVDKWLSGFEHSKVSSAALHRIN